MFIHSKDRTCICVLPILYYKTKTTSYKDNKDQDLCSNPPFLMFPEIITNVWLISFSSHKIINNMHPSEYKRPHSY